MTPARAGWPITPPGSPPLGAAVSLVVLVVWVYYSALIIFFGVELTKARTDQRGEKIEPLATAGFMPAPASA